jgi:hypothetical protein
MTYAVTLGAKTTLGNVTRYAFSLTRNTATLAASPGGTPYTSDDVQKKDLSKKTVNTTKSGK